MSHVESPPRGGEGQSRVKAAWLRRAGVGLVAPALAALAFGTAPVAAQAATTGGIAGSFAVPAGTHDPADVSIQIVDRNGTPVTVNPSDVTITDSSATGADYTVAGLDPGQYFVYFSDTTTGDNVAPDYYGDGGIDDINKATVVTVPATGGTQSLSTETLTAGATIGGTVTDANLAAETAAHVTAEPDSATTLSDPMLGGVEAAVDNKGYTITGLPAGGFSLVYSATGPSLHLSDTYVDGTGLTYDFGSATQYKVAAASATTASFAVPGLGGIAGKVADSTGNGLGGVYVYAYDAAGNVIPTGATTAVDGTYMIDDVLPGSYEVAFGGLGASDLAGSFYGGSTLATATRLTVSSGATTANINGTLTTGASVSGTVTAAQGGAALGGLDVRVVDGQGNMIAEATTNADGTYTLDDVPAGTWYLEFVGGLAYNGQYYATEYYLGRGTLGGSLPLKLTSGESLTGVNEALMVESPTLPGLPKVSLGRLGGLAGNKVGLSFRLTAGTGPAGYIGAFSIKLPKYVSWNRAALKRDIVIPRDKFTYAIKAGRLVISFPTGKKLVNFRIKPGGIRVGKKIQALAKRRRIASEAITLVVGDTTGRVSSTSYRVKRPH